MKYYKTFNNAGWDFKVWDIDNTAANYNDGYPFLAWQNNYQTLRDISSPVINIFALRSNGDTIAYNSTTNESEILLNFLSSEPTSNFAVEDISITNGKITNFKKISSTLYEAKLNLINQGKHEISISTIHFTDLAGSDNNSHSRFTLFFDNIGPIISILGPFPNKSFTNQTNVKLKIEINEKTLGFEKEDVNVLWGSISNFYQYVDGKSFDVEIFHDEERERKRSSSGLTLVNLRMNH